MGKQEIVANLFNRLLVLTISVVLLSGMSQSLSDKRLCADEDCKEIISMGKGKINYRAGEEGMVSFKINSPIRIKSKSAGKDRSVWGIEVNGREGYAPKEFILETKIFIKEQNLKYEVDVVKPGDEKPILSTSENIVAREVSAETTTTKPLEAIPTESNERPSHTKPNEVTKVESAAVATPLVMELVDGTQISKIDYDSESMTTSVKDDSVVNINNKTEIKFDNDVDDENEMGDYDEEEEEKEEEDDKLKMNSNKIDDVKHEENILPRYIDKVIKKPAEQEDAKKVISSEHIRDSSGSNENFLFSHNQRILKSSKEAEIEDKNKKSEKQASSIDQNVIKETIILNNTTTRNIKAATLNNILEYENGENLQEPVANPSVQIENHHRTIEERSEDVIADNVIAAEEIKSLHSSNVYKNEERTENVIPDNAIVGENMLSTKAEASKNSLENDKEEEASLTMEIKNLSENLVTNQKQNNVILSDNNTHQEHASYLENNSGSEDREADKELKEKPIVVSFDNSRTLNNNSLLENVPYTRNNVDNVDERESETVLTKTSTIIDTKTTQENVPYIQNDSNAISNSGEENEISTVAEINVNNHASNLEETESNVENSLNKKPEELDDNISTTTTLPKMVIEESTSGSDTISLESQTSIENQNTFTEASIDMNLPSQKNNNEDLYLTSLTTEIPQSNFYEHQSTYYDENAYVTENPDPNSNIVDDSSTTKDFTKIEEKDAKTTSIPKENNVKENKGLYATIMGTVNSVLSINNKKIKPNENVDDNLELNRILFPKIIEENKIKANEEDLQYCKQIGPNGECPQQQLKTYCDCSIIDTVFNSDLTFDAFIKALAAKILEISEVLAFLVIVAAASLFFIFGYYCFCNTSREGALLSKLNQLESCLLASQKENALLKHNLMSTRQKLASIEDNSFGSNDMVVSLKKDLEEELLEKSRLQDQITALQKELENAADAGIELNKIVSELLSNQTGDESIISSVEDLQKQLNEQQNTILEINASLAEKSRENSELQLLIAEQNARYESELANLQRDNDELEHEKGSLLTRLEELKTDFDRDITTALEGKNIEIKRLQNEIIELNNKIESEHTKWQTSMAKVEALEECLKNVKKDPSVNITEIIDVANVKAQLIESQRKYKNFKERLESELDTRKLVENQLKIVSAEVEKLKQDFNQSEKDKLEAQTRLEVLSNYFKEKENQLQKELSLKEAMWLKQQGETTTTVDRLTAMQEEIQSLKSQNDSLRAEIEAQVAAHKAQTGTLENRAHETWLAARQSDRRYEEARAEATALRRKLTALAGGNINESKTGTITLGEELTNVPSPIHIESPGSPMLGRMPPPPFLPPPFMGPPPPFIGMPPPPPPFVPPGEMRPAPLGRIMSPPPQRSGRFSPPPLDYEDYLDYEGNNTWQRHTYSPPPRTYRSLSPTDSRYDYGTERDLMSTYDTETDFSPPPSPRESRRRGGGNNSDLLKNPNNTRRFNNKGPLSSGSEKSYNSPSHHDTKTKKGSTSGKSIV